MTTTLPTVQASSAPSLGYGFPVVQAQQSREYYWMSALPVPMLLPMFQEWINRSKLPASNLQSSFHIVQRSINWVRVQKLYRYIQKGVTEENGFFILPPLTIGIDADLEMIEWGEDMGGILSGVLRITSENPKFYCYDGQHRIAALLKALNEIPALMTLESIGVKFLLDMGGARRQQIFLDLNQNTVKPNKSLFVAMDHTTDLAEITRQVVQQVPVFAGGRTAIEATAIQSKSDQLVALSSLAEANQSLLADYDGDRLALAVQFWTGVSQSIRVWKEVQNDSLNVPVLRDGSIAFHGITLAALGLVGGELVEAGGTDWQTALAALNTIDWSRTNPQWINMFIFGGKIKKDKRTIRALANFIRSQLK